MVNSHDPRPVLDALKLKWRIIQKPYSKSGIISVERGKFYLLTEYSSTADMDENISQAFGTVLHCRPPCGFIQTFRGLKEIKGARIYFADAVADDNS